MNKIYLLALAIALPAQAATADAESVYAWGAWAQNIQPAAGQIARIAPAPVVKPEVNFRPNENSSFNRIDLVAQAAAAQAVANAAAQVVADAAAQAAADAAAQAVADAVADAAAQAAAQAAADAAAQAIADAAVQAAANAALLAANSNIVAIPEGTSLTGGAGLSNGGF